MKKILVTYLLCFFVCLVSAQTNTIRVKKRDSRLKGKTIQALDARGIPCGNLFFSTNDSCTISFQMVHSASLVCSYFLNKITINTQEKGMYQELTDTSFLFLSANGFSDTCWFNLQASQVKFKRMLYGEVEKDDYAIFYGIDSVIYSPSARNYFRAQAFTDTMLTNDSLFNDVVDKKLRKQKQIEYQLALLNYKETLSITDFRGRYAYRDSSIYLIGSRNQRFMRITLVKVGEDYVLKSNQNAFLSGNIRSNYKRNAFGFVSVKGDKATIDYSKMVADTAKLSRQLSARILKQEYDVLSNSQFQIELIKDSDVLVLSKDPLKVTNRLGGCYPFKRKTLTGNVMDSSYICFIEDKAYWMDDSLQIRKTYAYQVTDNVLAIYDEKDTLIDELEDGFKNSVYITYRNNQPICEAAYHEKNEKGEHVFIILFSNGNGGIYVSNTFDYKEVRRCLKAGNTSSLYSGNLQLFTYEASETSIWLTLESGDYKQLDFFNHYKGLRLQTNAEEKRYYTID